MEKPTTCRCGGDLEQPAEGRPRVYCSTACRRDAEYELRRVQGMLTVAERAEQKARAEMVGRSWGDGDLSPLVKFWRDEMAYQEGRLHELLAGVATTERDSATSGERGAS